MVRHLVRETLVRAGYKVMDTSDPREARRLSDSYQGPIHLLITDVVMPKISGRELAEELRARRSGMKVLYMSGYTDHAIVEHRHSPQGSGVSAKALHSRRTHRKGARSSGKQRAHAPGREIAVRGTTDLQICARTRTLAVKCRLPGLQPECGINSVPNPLPADQRAASVERPFRLQRRHPADVLRRMPVRIPAWQAGRPLYGGDERAFQKARARSLSISFWNLSLRTGSSTTSTLQPSSWVRCCSRSSNRPK